MSEYILSLDVESAGLYGCGFWVGACLFEDGVEIESFEFSCSYDVHAVFATDEDANWLKDNIPEFTPTHDTAKEVRAAFWGKYLELKGKYPNLIVAVECGFPVETNFFAACVYDDVKSRKWQAPYPLMEISTMMIAAGMNPMANYDRLENELPKHNPVADARQSARLLFEAKRKLNI